MTDGDTMWRWWTRVMPGMYPVPAAPPPQSFDQIVFQED